MNEEGLKNAHILMLDDDVAYLSLLKNVLGRMGYKHLRCIKDATFVFDEIGNFQPDLLILDLSMPNIDGLQVLDQIRTSILHEAGFPILVVTGEGSNQNTRKALAAGATDLLRKPFDTSELMIRIRNLLETRFLQFEIRLQNRILEEKVEERTSELERTLSELKSAQNHMVQQARLNAFGEMAAGVVHDFKNSLMSVIGYSELLLGDPALLADESMVRQYLQIMNTAGRDAANMIGRLRDFYRPREETDLFEPIDINKIIKQAILLTQPKWKEQGMAEGREIMVDFDFAKIPRVFGNASEMRTVVTNIIFNAVDAMPQGGMITLYTAFKDGDVIFEVRDTGTGMTKETRDRCLEPFYSTKGQKGTGLGLSMVFGIVQRHDGKLEIDSEPGRGTVIRIRIPSHDAVAWVPTEAWPRIDHSLRILVAEDDAVARDVLSKYLLMDGHEVVAVSNGPDAFEQLKTGSFDLLLTDHAMPGMNGLQLANALKETGGNQPVIIVTGIEDEEIFPRDGSNPPGIDAVLNKPVSHNELRHALAGVLSPLAA